MTKFLFAFFLLLSSFNAARADCKNQPPLKDAEIEFYAEGLARSYANENLEKDAADAYAERGRKLGLDEARMDCMLMRVVDAVRVQKGEAQILTTEPLTTEEMASVKKHLDVLEPMAKTYEAVFGIQTPQGRTLVRPER